MQTGTRYVLLGIRTFIDLNDPQDPAKVHALQDAVTIRQKHPGTFEALNWDPVTHKQVRDALIVLAGNTAYRDPEWQMGVPGGKAETALTSPRQA